MDNILHDYGWAAALIWLAGKEIIPVIRHWLERKTDNDAEQVAAEINMKEAEMARDTAREERMVKAMEQMADSTNSIKQLVSSVNVRLELIERHLGLGKPDTKPHGKQA